MKPPISKNSAKTPKGPFSASCPTREILDQIADKWSVLLLLAVWDEPRRFNELKRLVEGISQKVMGQSLQRLERNGLVQRKVLSLKPIAVAYSITPHGQDLAAIVDQLRSWAITSLKRTQAAQVQFDAKAKSSDVENAHVHRI
jgi:DNA-binding HxlR family transcriptional regulator